MALAIYCHNPQGLYKLFQELSLTNLTQRKIFSYQNYAHVSKTTIQLKFYTRSGHTLRDFSQSTTHCQTFEVNDQTCQINEKHYIVDTPDCLLV